MDLIAVKRDFYKNSPRTVEGMLKAYIEGVAALEPRKSWLIRFWGNICWAEATRSTRPMSMPSSI